VVSPLRVVIADDHPFYRQGLAKLLTASGVEVAAEAGDGWEALRAVAQELPDVAIVDLGMPGLSGTEVTRRLTACSPPHRVMILSVSDDEADVDAALRAGASGYFLKDGPVEEVVAGIQAVAVGESLFSPRIGSMLLRRMRERATTSREPVSLSPRELEVLRLVVEGRSNEMIGAGLCIDPGTARNHVSHILSKLGVDNRVQAAVRAVREGLV
jgi:DNA-binding NarL/FixJ family response regulator